MEITLRRKNDAVHFEASNSDGNTVQIDGSPAVGGEGKGFRPMEMLLAALAGCASMDLVPILRKQRQQVDDISVTVRGVRAEGVVPAPFEQVELVFAVSGGVNRAAAERAVALAVEKYCSVAETLSEAVRISWRVEIAERPAAAGPPA